ncbi:hypothetical protein, partial [Neisseria meningitidis]|uniref:hypothetical protein n=1 Tax=Neisseria meningitidis TaxID=487 RepID=UPI00046DB541
TIKTVGHLQPSFPRRRESGISMPQEFIGKNQTLPPSFPRKWESRNEKQQEFIGNDRNRTDWIPA